ncbi:MAG: hybrid sensor histidine kinase/response regulator [Bdellovibrionota bacterium]
MSNYSTYEGRLKISSNEIIINIKHIHLRLRQMKATNRFANRVILSISHRITQLQKLILWAPVLTLIFGFALTYYIYAHLKDRDDFIQKSIFTQTAREELTKIDLLLTNSILKIQSYENNLEDRPMDYTKDEPYLDLVLRHTLFERMSIIQEQGDKYKALLRVNTPDSTIPDAASNYLQSNDIKSIIKDLKKTSGLLTTLVFENNDRPYLSVVLRSRFHRKIYFLFTTPLSNLFNQTILTDSNSIVVQAGNSVTPWVIHSQGQAKKVISKYIDIPDPNITNVRFTNSLPQSNINLAIDFHYAPMRTKFLSPEKSAAALGFLLTLVISYLFYTLINQNRLANKLIVSKTLDLEKTAHDLQLALNSKAHFFGKISHEIRTPLNLILGMIDLCNEVNADNVVQNYLKTMHTSGEHLLSMMDDLIELAQAEKNEMTFQERTIYMAQFLGDVVKLAGQDCKTKGLEIYLHLDKSMPACVVTDPNRLRQVLLNLLRNACKYTLKGHVILAVQATESLITNRVKFRFEIKDTGIGIPADKLSKVFDAFFQVENSKTYAEGGVGLGLSIVKDIIKKMHGKISVQSTPKKGSIFTVDLEFKRSDRTNWYEIYKTHDVSKYTAVLLSSDPHLQKSFASLAQHPNIEEVIYITEDFAKVLLLTDPNRTYWFVHDPETANIDLEILAKAFGRHVFVLGQGKIQQTFAHLNINHLSNSPFLPYELLTANGFTSRSRHRKHLSSAQIRAKAPATLANLANLANNLPLVTPKDNLSIIVADDDHGNIELYKAYFAKSTWQVNYNYDGETAWQSFEKKLPDLLILDVRMPNMDGFQLIEKIRDYEKQRNIKPIPVILVTADLLDYTAKTAKTFDDVTLLSKPIKKKLLFDAIHNVSMNYR